MPGKRSPFDFCENGAEAVAHESDRRRVTADFFAEHSVAELSGRSDYWLEQQGRLTEPMVLRAGATHYAPITWDDAFAGPFHLPREPPPTCSLAPVPMVVVRERRAAATIRRSASR